MRQTASQKMIFMQRLFAATVTLVLGAAVCPAGTPQASVGAPMPFVEFNAATSPGITTNQTITLSPNYNFGTLASEATGRQAVLLTGTGSSVSFTLTESANAITVHYAIPDAPNGNGITAPLPFMSTTPTVPLLRCR